MVNSLLQDPAAAALYEDHGDLNRVIDSLVALRRALGLTQTEVARRMGVKQPTISGFENEGSDPHLSTLQRYARAVAARLCLQIEMPASCDWLDQSHYSAHVRPAVRVAEAKVQRSTTATSARRWSVVADALDARVDGDGFGLAS